MAGESRKVDRSGKTQHKFLQEFCQDNVSTGRCRIIVEKGVPQYNKNLVVDI